ncbi:MAG: undecaprenyldiphospho-muramoylpentapeptide beta-N-acetylglucosaminyltransferase [Elusimicrobiota bacterium]|nr:undecaprenyldiphospho-muramoylpentapeptide beta-N-acetylglucosaminyltransferase [Elusimicrobiota bacterium]
MRILIVLGGTGGHIYPGLALGEKLRSRNNQIILVGKKGGIGERIARESRFPFFQIAGEGLVRKFSLKVFPFLAKFLQGFFQSIQIFRSFRPDIVVGMGGYLGFSPVLAARVSRITCTIHEPNVLPGLANRVLARIVDRIMVSFKETEKYFPSKNTFLTGSPVRQSILNCPRSEGLRKLDMVEGKKNILVFGGSQGARSINLAMVKALDFLDPLEKKIQIIHIVGVEQFPEIKEKYEKKNYPARVLPYLLDMEYAYSCCDLVISRSGASTVAEIIAKGLPSILIPYPYATSGHQKANAEFLSKRGGCLLIEDSQLTGELLADVIIRLIGDEAELRGMAKNTRRLSINDAATKMADLIEAM